MGREGTVRFGIYPAGWCSECSVLPLVDSVFVIFSGSFVVFACEEKGTAESADTGAGKAVFVRDAGSIKWAGGRVFRGECFWGGAKRTAEGSGE